MEDRLNFIRIANLRENEGKTVNVRGWVYNIRTSGKIAFIQLRDGTGICQLVVEASSSSQDALDRAQKLHIEAAIKAQGTCKLDSRAPGGVELLIKDLEILADSQDYPLGRKEHGTEFLLDHRHLWLRSPKQAAIQRIRSNLSHSARLFLNNEGFYEFNSPIFTPTACEETTELFEVKYFDTSVFLTQSGQLYSEAGITSLERVFYFGPCFRSERSKTRKHLTEFWAIEPEMAWFNAEDNMAFQERFIKYIVSYVLENNESDLAILERDTKEIDISSKSFEVMTYDEALNQLRQSGFDPVWGKDIGAPEESHLVKSMDRPFFIYKYPVEARAFYIERDPLHPELALSSDTLLCGEYGSEICTGGQRASSVEFLEEQIKRLGLVREDYEWYLDLRRYGSVPHSGFGMGIERTVRWICGAKHVRETIPFPRMLYRTKP